MGSIPDFCFGYSGSGTLTEYGPVEAEVLGGVVAKFSGLGAGSAGEAVLGIDEKHASKRLAACGVDTSCM